MNLKNYNAVYRYGHFYDVRTGKRIIIKDRAEVALVASAPDVSKLPLHYEGELLTPLEQVIQISGEGKVKQHKKIMDRGSFLYFHVGAEDDNGVPDRHFFQIELLEDLYIYLTFNNKVRFYDCACKLAANPSNTIEFFEVIFGKSLGELYRKTCVHYLGSHRTTSTQMHQTVFTNPRDEKSFLDLNID